MEPGIFSLIPAPHVLGGAGEVGPLSPIVPRPPVEKVMPDERHSQREHRKDPHPEDTRRVPLGDDDPHHVDEYARTGRNDV